MQCVEIRYRKVRGVLHSYADWHASPSSIVEVGFSLQPLAARAKILQKTHYFLS